MGCNENIDYGYASASSSSSSLWLSREKWPSFSSQDLMDIRQKPATHMDVWMRRRSVDDVMREFRMNGLDSPYNPDDDNIWAMRAGETILGTSHGTGAGGRQLGYTRQHSWPETSAPRPSPATLPDWRRGEFATSTPIFDGKILGTSHGTGAGGRQLGYTRQHSWPETSAPRPSPATLPDWRRGEFATSTPIFDGKILGTSHGTGAGGRQLGYTRQHSWPETSAPRPSPATLPDWRRGEFATSTPIFDGKILGTSHGTGAGGRQLGYTRQHSWPETSAPRPSPATLPDWRRGEFATSTPIFDGKILDTSHGTGAGGRQLGYTRQHSWPETSAPRPSPATLPDWRRGEFATSTPIFDGKILGTSHGTGAGGRQLGYTRQHSWPETSAPAPAPRPSPATLPDWRRGEFATSTPIFDGKILGTSHGTGAGGRQLGYTRQHSWPETSAPRPSPATLPDWRRGEFATSTPIFDGKILGTSHGTGAGGRQLGYTRQHSWPETSAPAPRPSPATLPDWRRGEFATSTPIFDGKILGTSHGTGAGGRQLGYTRQHSWPETSAPRPSPATLPDWRRGEFATSTPIFDESQIPPLEGLTEEQSRALRSLPDDVLCSLLRWLRARNQLHKKNKNQECRFCKNNGERESYYRSHSLKSDGRVSCPVLRAFVCRRCGATGDDAHTLKYCPLATAAERLKSLAMMHSVRMASGRKRYTLPPSAVDSEDYVHFGDTTPSVVRDNDVYNSFAAAPLNPSWAAVEKKLML